MYLPPLQTVSFSMPGFLQPIGVLRAVEITWHGLARWNTTTRTTINRCRFSKQPRSSRQVAHLQTSKMRTYDDSFSGQRIYPGKVCSLSLFPSPFALLRFDMSGHSHQNLDSLLRNRRVPSFFFFFFFSNSFYCDSYKKEMRGWLDSFCSIMIG